MFKRIALALAIASTMSIAAVPAEAGPFRDKLKNGLREIGGVGVIVASCVKQRLTGQPAFFCPR